MSSFSDSILKLLLSGVRGVLNDLWNMLSGNAGSLFGWLGRHWLSLICILLIGGVTIDLLVYLLRWKPQRVWISKFNRLFRRGTEEELTFNDGYAGGIESFELDSDPVISEYINAAPQLEQFDAGVQPIPDPEPLPEPIQDSVDPVPVRRRRSDRHARRGIRKHLISLKLPSLEEAETPYTSYPAPPVQAREAFHDAVYPTDNQSLWQQSSNRNSHANN